MPPMATAFTSATRAMRPIRAGCSRWAVSANRPKAKADLLQAEAVRAVVRATWSRRRGAEGAVVADREDEDEEPVPRARARELITALDTRMICSIM